jgi:hypothetical protein
LPIERYNEMDLQNDLAESDKNVDIPFDKIIKIGQEKKRWGTLLKLEFVKDENTKGYKFMVVKGWVKYPLKDPVSFQEMNWDPIMALIKK